MIPLVYAARSSKRASAVASVFSRICGPVGGDLCTAMMFDITKPQLFLHLSLGRRVTIEMDGEGGANKVIGAFTGGNFSVSRLNAYPRKDIPT